MTVKSDAELAQNRGISVEQLEMLRDTRGLTDEAIEKLPQPALMRSLRRVDYPDMPRQRQLFRLAQSGAYTPAQQAGALASALHQLDSLRLRTPPGRYAGLAAGGPVPSGPPSVRPPPPVGGLARPRWVALGPGHIGGRTRTVLPHPTLHRTIWVGSVGGGVWRTDDSGETWFPVDDFMNNLVVTSLVMHPADPNIIYAGTGEGFGNLDSLRGAGLFRTTNGVTWTQVPSTDTTDFRQVNRLAFSADGTTLLVATNKGIFRSVDAAHAAWTRVLATAAADVRCHPIDSRAAVAGSMSSGEAWATSDGGLTWSAATHAGPWSGRVELCYAKADPRTVYASVNVNKGQIWRSTDGGQGFLQRASKTANNLPARYLGDQGWYDNAIWAGDPTDAELVIVGGIDLWRSTDGGNTLTDISTWWDDRSAHADQHFIISHPGYNGTTDRAVYFSNDGGVYRADDVKTVGSEVQPPKVGGWIKLNNAYGVTQFYGAAVQPATGVIICGAQDNGTLAFHPNAAGQKWQTIFGGDGGFCAADPSDPKIFYGEYVFLNIFRSTDGASSDDLSGDRYISGQFWNAAIGRWDWKLEPFRIPDAFNQRSLFIAPFALDPNNPATILAGGESLWRTKDAKAPNTNTTGPRWVRIKPPSNGMISAIAIDPKNSDHVWIGHTSGELWLSTDATSPSPTWQRVDSRGPQPVNIARWVHQIEISQHDSNLVTIAYGEFKPGNAWQTRDRGGTWTNIGATLPDAPIRAVTHHPDLPDVLYVGTEVGVFGSEDQGLTWSPVNEGPANVSVDDLVWNSRTLACVTHGRGVFTIDLTPPIA